jgi:hypothetical protein
MTDGSGATHWTFDVFGEVVTHEQDFAAID